MKRVGLLLSLVLVMGCGGAAATLLNLIPAIRSLTQTSINSGGGPFLLGIVGDNFLPGAKVVFNGFERETVQLDPGELNATILASDISSSGQYPVTVRNPDGSESQAVIFTVNP